MKIRKRRCKSLREFYKIERKYIKGFATVKNWRHNWHSFWYDWISYDVIGLDALNDPYFVKKAVTPHKYKTKYDGVCETVTVYDNLKTIREDVIARYGETFIRKGVEWKLVGVQVASDDYYYIFQDKDGQLAYSTCVGYIDDFASR